MSEPEMTIVMPALNEQKNIHAAMHNTLAAFDDLEMRGELLVIDDGSTDGTTALIAARMAKDSRVRTLRHDKPQGIGAAFWDGVQHARGDYVCMLPGDNENDPWEILRYYPMLRHVDIVIPFVFNKQARSRFRNSLSFLYRFIINSTFFVNFNYTNGTVMYRRKVLQELEFHSNGFFFQTDILVRLVKRGYLFAEVPYQLNARVHGVSKAVSFPSFLRVVKGYLRLVRDIHWSRRGGTVGGFEPGSITAQRHQSPVLLHQSAFCDEEAA